MARGRQKRGSPKRKSRKRSRFRSAAVKVLAALVLAALVAGGAVFFQYYDRYSRIIDRRLDGEVFSNTARIYAAPYALYPGQAITPGEAAVRLRRAGLERRDGELDADAVYGMEVDGDRTAIVVSPADGPDYRMDFRGGAFTGAAEVLSGFPMDRVHLPPELVTTLFD